MFKSIMITAIALAATSNARASDWVQYGEDKDGTTMYWDRASLHFQGNARVVWIKNVFNPNTMHGNGPHSGRWMREAISQDFVLCDTLRNGIGAQTIYYYDNYDSWSARDESVLYTAIVPDTFGEILVNQICNVPAMQIRTAQR